MSMSVEWSQLPPELLLTISKKLTIYADYLRFRAACRGWRSSSPPTPLHLPPQLPWLMLPPDLDHGHPFFSLSDEKFLFLLNPEPSALQRRCGSSLGWVPLLDDNSPEILLLNPLTRSRIRLPPLTSFPNVASFDYACVGREYSLRNSFGDLYARSLRHMRDSFIKKLVLSHSPSHPQGFLALAILAHTGDLAYCAGGDDHTVTGWKFIHQAHSFCEDAVYHKGLFYAVDRYAALAVCDLVSGEVQIVHVQRRFKGDMHYLVHCGDDLMLVTRYVELEQRDRLHLVYRTVMFEVYRMEWGAPPRWDRLRGSLGGRAVFLGENSSFSLLASDFPGCRGDCIYYTDDYSESNYDGVYGEHDVGIFNFCDETIQQLSCYPRNLHTRLRWPPPIWVSPNPC